MITSTSDIKLFPNVIIPPDESVSEDERKKLIQNFIESLFEGDRVTSVSKLSGGVTNICKYEDPVEE